MIDAITFTVKEVCALMRITDSTLRNWTASGKFPKPLKCSEGGTLFWYKADINVWVNQNRHYKD